MLMLADADVNFIFFNFDGDVRTSAHVAAARGHVKTPKLLLDAGADLNAEDNRGITPWDLADWDEDEGKKVVVKEVLSEYSLHVVAKVNNTEHVKALRGAT